MQEKDVVSKDLLKRITLDIARILLGLEVEQAEIVESSHPRVEERRADLVARMAGPAGQFLLHIEVQNGNDGQMPCRMLRYRSDLCLQCTSAARDQMQHKNGPQNLPNFMLYMVRLKGLEPLTYGLEGRCSIQLSYRRIGMIEQ